MHVISFALSHLLIHDQQRGTRRPYEQLLRYRNGQPITYRRYDHLWTRLGKHLPWVAIQQISTHCLRYTTLSWVERTSATQRRRLGARQYRSAHLRLQPHRRTPA